MPNDQLSIPSVSERDKPLSRTKATPLARSENHDVRAKAIVRTRKRGRPARTASFVRVEFDIAENDGIQIGNIKKDVGARTTSEVLRLAVRNLIFLVMHARQGYEFFAVRKDDPSDRIKLKIVL